MKYRIQTAWVDGEMIRIQAKSEMKYGIENFSIFLSGNLPLILCEWHCQTSPIKHREKYTRKLFIRRYLEMKVEVK